MSTHELGHAVMVVAPLEGDMTAVAGLLRGGGIEVEPCRSLKECADRVLAEPGAIVLTEEALELPQLAHLAAALQSQPPWSEIPLIVLTEGGESRIEKLFSLTAAASGNVTLLERPMSTATLLRAVQVALRFRRRQYQVRELLELQQRQNRDLAAAHERLRESERLFRTMGETVPDFLWMSDAAGRILYQNPARAAYLGRTPELLCERGWSEICHPADLSELVARWTRALAQGTPVEFDARLRRYDGIYRWFHGRIAPFKNQDGSVVGWVGCSTDIDDLKRAGEELGWQAAELAVVLGDRQVLLESERAARTEAERATRLKDEFLATLSHELRTPLNAILGWAGLLTKESDPASLAEGLSVIERCARSQARLIEDLLDLSRIVSGKIRLEVQTVDLDTVIRQAVETVRASAEEKEIRLEQHLDPSVGPVRGDPYRLQQILWNLLSNAIKFTPKKGRVAVQFRRVDAEVEINVVDNGKGIKPEFLPNVFERFRQEDPSTTRRYGGLGLGLAIVKRLIELHGGTVAVCSLGEGQGSTFTIRLPVMAAEPVSEEQSAPPPPLPAEQTDLRASSVLVVDDDESACEIVRRILQESNARVYTARSADEALHKIVHLRPDVLVSDIGMPDRDGYDLIASVRALEVPTIARTPAVAVTAFARPQDRAKALKAGFDKYVAKPVEPTELISAVATLAREAMQNTARDHGPRQEAPAKRSPPAGADE